MKTGELIFPLLGRAWVIPVLCFVFSRKYSFFWKQCVFRVLFPLLDPLQEALPHTLLKLMNGIGVSQVELGFPGQVWLCFPGSA